MSHDRLGASRPDRRRPVKAGAFRATPLRGYGLDRLSSAWQVARKRSRLKANGTVPLLTQASTRYQFERPVFGARYRAMKYGPVPLEVYEMLKGEPLWLYETGKDAFPWCVRGRGRIARNGELPQPNLGVFSESDLEHLRAGFARARAMTFTERTRETHGPDWRKANLGIMDYADMIEDGPDPEERIEELRGIAPRMVI